MELKATSLGKHLAQHPYNRVKLLAAGVEVKGEQHEYIIPFNQLLAINCKRGLVWGELEFLLPDDKVVRLHGTEWSETQHFYQHLDAHWQKWSHQMSEIAALVLAEQFDKITRQTQQEKWFKRTDLQALQQKIRVAFASLPLPVSRLASFDNCRKTAAACGLWLKQGEARCAARNQQYTEHMLKKYADFFARVESSPLNSSQARAVVNGEESLLVLAGAGSGKTSVLVARAGWLIQRQEASEEQILLLAFGREAALEMDRRIAERLHTTGITTQTFHALARFIIEQGSKKTPQITRLESDRSARHQLLIESWQQQCSEKKAQAKGWREWLGEELQWSVPEGDFWQDDRLITRLAGRLDRWLGLLRMHGGSQAEMLASAPDEVRELFSKRLKLMAPLVKAWRNALKQEDAVDFSGLIHQAVNILDKGRFVSPWKHILVDEFQDISLQRARLLSALRRQNSHTSLYAVGDDWQAIYRFSGAEIELTTRFSHYFGDAALCVLDTTYRFNGRIGEIANQFIQQNPHQLPKPLNSLSDGDKKAVTLLDDSQLEALLDKLSGYVKPQQRILVLARYHYLLPASLASAATRWPKLTIDFMTLHASKGQEADFVIILGLQQGNDGFPAPARESVMEQALLPEPDDFPDAEERRLLYVAITRARHRVWLLFNKKNPSSFVAVLKQLGVPVISRP